MDLSDVAILVRLRNAGEWLRWINVGLMAKWVGDDASSPRTLEGRRLRVVDATRVKEPGLRGPTWCLHYAIGLPSLAADTCVLGDVHDNGESFTRFAVAKGDVLVTRDAAPVANRLACPQGSTALIMAGTETGTMPVGLEHHVGAPGARHRLRGRRAAAVTAQPRRVLQVQHLPRGVGRDRPRPR